MPFAGSASVNGRRALILAALGAAPLTVTKTALLRGLDSQMLPVLLPTYPADTNQLPGSWRSRATFHMFTLVAAMSLLKLRNGPLIENGAFWSKVTGKMFVWP